MLWVYIFLWELKYSKLSEIIFFKYFIYLFDTEREITSRQRGRQREREEAGSLLSREPDVRLDPRTLRSWPELKAEALTHCATQVPRRSTFLKILFIYLRERKRDSSSRKSSRQREKQAPHWAESPMRGSIPGPWDHDLSRRQMLNWQIPRRPWPYF